MILKKNLLQYKKKLKSILEDTKALINTLQENAKKNESINEIDFEMFLNKTEQECNTLKEKISSLKEKVSSLIDKVISEIKEDKTTNEYEFVQKIKANINHAHHKILLIEDEILSDAKKLPKELKHQLIQIKDRIESEITILKADIDKINNILSKDSLEITSEVVEEGIYDTSLFDELVRKSLETSIKKIKKMQKSLIKIEIRISELTSALPDESEIKTNLETEVKNIKIFLIDSSQILERLITKYRANVQLTRESVTELDDHIQKTSFHIKALSNLIKDMSIESLTSSELQTYIVKDGETIESLSVQFGVDLEEIKTLNPNIESQLEKGTYIFIPNKQT